VEKMAILNVNEKEEACACRKKLVVACQQNIANQLFLLWVIPISLHCRGNMLSEERS
jgi:hypothetical protein